MSYESDDIDRAVEISGCGAVRLSAERADEICTGIARRYTTFKKRYLDISEDFQNCLSVRDLQGWEWAADLIGDRECYFVADGFHPFGYLFPDGYSVVDMYDRSDDCVDFYLTDREFSYVLCYIGSSYIIACGEAVPWLEEYCSKHNKYEEYRYRIGGIMTRKRDMSKPWKEVAGTGRI